ncbi:MAG TPA: polysaccharide biosynthesis C-terminal domain-containing protein [Nitrolancea sp.]
MSQSWAMMRRVVAQPGIWALTDQALVSLGGVATTIILARSLPPATFGVYVLLFGAMLFLNTVHASLVVYPLSIHGARATPKQMPHLTGSFLVLALLFASPLVVPFGAMTAALASWKVVPWAIIALLAWQCQETTRRALFAEMRLRAAIPGDFIAYLGQAALILLLAQRGNLTLPTVFMVMIITSLAGLMLQLTRVHPRLALGASPATLARVALNDGRWVLPSNLLGSFSMQGLLWMLALIEHTRGAADLQSVITIVGVANPVMFGLGNLLIPMMARARQTTSMAEGRRQFASAFGLGGVLLLPYTLLLWILPSHVLTLVYGTSSPYNGLTTPLRLLALAYLLVYMAHVSNAALFGLERLHAALVVQIAGSVTLIAAGGLLTLIWGVTGAALATLLVHLVRTMLSLRALRPALLPNEQRLTTLIESA